MFLSAFHPILKNGAELSLYSLFVTKTPLEECCGVVEQHIFMLIPEHLQIRLCYAPVKH